MNITRHQIENYFFGNPKLIADKILFTKRQTRLHAYKEHLTEIYEFGNVWYGMTGVLRGQKMTIIVTGIGPSMVGDAVYALDKPDSICLYSGTCGGLHEDLHIGDYFIADHAVCGDGFTFHLGYTPLAEVAGDPGLLNSLKLFIARKSERFMSGTTFTTSSVVREADADFWKVVDKKWGHRHFMLPQPQHRREPQRASGSVICQPEGKASLTTSTHEILRTNRTDMTIRLILIWS